MLCSWLLLFCVSVFSEEENIGIMDILKVLGGISEESSSIEPQPMKVIGAGMGRTGTLSMKMAFRRLGLEPYHMMNVFETTGHFDVWRDFMKGENGIDSVIDLLARDGFNATTDMPYIHKELLEKYPDAKVVLGVRRDGEVWAKSILGTIGQNLYLLRLAPFKWISMMVDFAFMNEWMWQEFGLRLSEDFDPDTNMPTFESLARGHDSWISKVQESIPAEKLLIFKPTDGYGPLCDFLSSVDDKISTRCDEILENEEEYPHVNETAKMKMNFKFLFALTYVWWLIPLLLFAIVWQVIKCCCSKQKVKTQ